MIRVTAFTVTIIAAVIATVAAIVAALSKASAESQPSHQFSLSTMGIARHLAQDVVRMEVCRLPSRPLPFAPPRSQFFDQMVRREEARLDALLADHGDAAVCECLAVERATCP